MNHELTTSVWMHGKKVPCTVAYDLDGYKPCGLWVMDEAFNDVTIEIDEAEYDKLYNEACTHVAEAIEAKQEDRRDHEREDKEYWDELERMTK